MSAIYMSQLSTALPLMEGDHHQDHHHHHQGHFQAFTTLPKDPPILFPFVISSSSASDSSGLSYGSADGNHLLRQHHQAMLEPQHMFSGSSAASAFMTPFPTVESIRDDMIEPSSYDPYDMAAGKLQVGGPALETAAGSWTPPPAKMRITRKATAADPGAAKKPRRRAAQGCEEDMMGMGGGQPNLGVIRVCSDCNTTKTPLWRSGPCGPKSLCNACGIRQRKARRAMMASSWGSGPVPTDGGKAAATATTPRDAMGAAAAAHPKVKKEKSRVDADRSLPFKKRCKAVVQDHAAVAAPAATAFKPATDAEAVDDDAGGLSRDLKLVDNIGLISWSRTSPAPASGAASCSLFRASPGLPVQHQDEITDAAMLLMTLSCGLVRS